MFSIKTLSFFIKKYEELLNFRPIFCLILDIWLLKVMLVGNMSPIFRAKLSLKTHENVL